MKSNVSKIGLPCYFLVITLFCFSACKEKTIPCPIEEFLYPFKDMETSAQFIYMEDVTKKENIFHITKIDENRLVVVIIEDNQVIDSSIISSKPPYSHEELYRYDYDSVRNFLGITEGIIKIDKWLEDDSEFGTRLNTTSYTGEHIDFSYEIIEEFNKNINYYWNGDSIPALLFSRSLTMTGSSSKIPLLSKSQTYNGEVIYAKDIGTVMYSDDILGYVSTWKLREIIE